MTTLEKILTIGGATVLAISIAHCGGTTNTTPDMAKPADMTLPPDLAPFVAPTITSVAPATSINNAPASLTITGTGFRSGATVSIGGVSCANPSITATSITCTLPAKAATCGAQAVVVTNSDNQTATSATGFSFFTSVLTLNPATPATVAVQTSPDRTAVGDFNGDGKPDIVTVNQTNDTISLSLGNGDGTFKAATNTGTTGLNSRDLAVGDVNGDNKLDIVVVSPSNTIISTFLGNGDGTLQNVKTMNTPTNCNSVVLADLNGDKKLDVILGAGNQANVYVMLGNGDGTYAAGKANAVNGNTGAFGVYVADINGDGKLDVAASNPGTNTASVLLGNGDGTFGAFKVTATVVAGPNGIVAKDVNGDGKPDLVIAGQSAGNMNNIGLLLGNGDGTFQAQQTFTAGNAPNGLWVGDMNADGKPDVIVASGGSNNLNYLQGLGANGFAAAVVVQALAGSGPQIPTIADLNNDQLLDVVSPNNGLGNVSILLQQCK